VITSQLRVISMVAPDFSVPKLNALHGAGHEAGHLNGVLFIGHISKLKR
jgi:hypothetical protein